MKDAVRDRGRMEKILEGLAAYDYFVALRESILNYAAESISVFDQVTWLNLLRDVNPRVLQLDYFQAELEPLSILQTAANLTGQPAGEKNRITVPR
ncbi:hypothetical protein P9139_20220 [Curtobacterium flaccumfaciens]|nr:hypothetical protein P9139_20220 [Curtobacterium flaccumfaciens]